MILVTAYSDCGSFVFPVAMITIWIVRAVMRSNGSNESSRRERTHLPRPTPSPPKPPEEEIEVEPGWDEARTGSRRSGGPNRNPVPPKRPSFGDSRKDDEW